MEPVQEAGDLERQAVAWLVRCEASDCSAEERARLQAWLASPRHRAAYVRMRAAWSQADQLRCLQPPDGDVNPDLLEGALEPARKGSRALMLGYILVLLAFTVVVSGVTAWLVAERSL